MAPPPLGLHLLLGELVQRDQRRVIGL